SVQAVFRKNTGSRMTIVLSTDYLEEIEARPDGHLVLEKVTVIDGVESTQELGKVNFEDSRLDRGSRSQKLTLSGTKSLSSYYTSTANLEVVDLAEVNELSTDNLDITCSPFNPILPGETAQVYYPYDYILSDYVIEEISISASISSLVFKITEVAP
ncbi:MAG: hypothetical protein RPT95_13785, partial [Candidatus Sedimenticola sp. (ex Thyasira tokunagai)]